MSAHQSHAEALGAAGEPCRACGALLAADQRYCLNCGQRRGSARIDFRRHLGAGATPVSEGAAPPPLAPAAEAPAPPPEGRQQRDYTPLAAVGGIAVLGVMLLIGVLIGKGEGPSATSAPPQILRVEEPAGGQETASGEEAGTEDSTAQKSKKASGGGKAAKDANSLVGGKAGGGPVQASDEALKELQEQSPEEYSENSAKLPDEIATGGAPPPPDDKAPGGGSKGTAIE